MSCGNHGSIFLRGSLKQTKSNSKPQQINIQIDNVRLVSTVSEAGVYHIQDWLCWLVSAVSVAEVAVADVVVCYN